MGVQVGMGREHSKWGRILSEGSGRSKRIEVGQGVGSGWMGEALNAGVRR